MFRQNFLPKGALAVLTFCGLFLTGLPLAGEAPERNKGLFYYVVDQSGSITVYGLTEPIRRAITEHAAQLPEETEVRLVYFSRRASESKRWESMTPEAKTDFADYFAKNFTPNGPTRLYDTIGEVLEEVRSASGDYRFVSVLVFSDGENNWSQKFRSWRSLEPLYTDLVQRHKQSFVYWITLEFDPAESPPEWVFHEPQAPGTTEIPIPEPAPQADFTAYPRQLKTGEPLQFEFAVRGGRVDEYLWDFGDGTTSSKQNPVHQYEHDGVYTVQLRTTGPGGEAEEIKSDFIQVIPAVPLTASFRSSPETLRTGETLHLQDLSEGNPEEREWLVNGESFSADAAPSILLEEPGEIKISLSVKRGGETDVAEKSLTILPPAPPAGFTVDPAEAKFGETVVFTADETEEGWQHGWTIDGETTLEGASVEWEAERHGLMNVVHTVEGPGGLSRHSDRLFIHPPVEVVPETRFSVDPRVFLEGDTVTFRARETQDDWIHEWYLGGELLGEGAEWEWESDRTGSISIMHRIRIPDTDAVFEETDEVLGQKHELIQVAFSSSVTEGTYPLEVHFKDESVGRAVAYQWDFGDGNGSSQRNPVHTYQSAGDFHVTLSVTNPQGEVTTNPEPVRLAISAPMPFWQKFLIGVAVAFVVWVTLIVPLILRPMLSPQRGPKLVGVRTYPLHMSARRHGWSRFVWPHKFVTVGLGPGSDLRLPANNGARGNVALIERMPAASVYSIRPVDRNEIFRIEQQTSLMNPYMEERAKVTGPRTLKDGDTYEIAGERLTWHQPRPRKRVARKAPKKQRRLATVKH